MKKRILIVSLCLFFLEVNYVSAESLPVRTTQSLYQKSASTSGEKMQNLRQENKRDIKELRAEYQANLQTLKDARKKTIVTRLNNNIVLANQKATTTMAKGLEKIAALLARMSVQIQMLKAQGKDVIAAEAAVTAAQTEIATAKNAITIQAANTYVLDISDEATLKTTIGATVSQLRTDLKGTFQTVQAAREAVAQVARALALISPVTENSASSSATQL